MRRALALALALASSPALAQFPSSADVVALKRTVTSQGTMIDLMRSSVVNAMACTTLQPFCTSGSSATTTGSITTGTATLTVASASDFRVGQGIWVSGAGAAGVDLVAKITRIAGTTFTLDTNASTTRSNVSVTHDDTAAIQAAINYAPSGGPVYLPGGYYRISQVTSFGSALLFKTFTSLTGAGIHAPGLSATGGGQGTTLDGVHVTGYQARAVRFSATGEGMANRLANLTVIGSQTNTNNIGVDASTTGSVVDTVYVNGFGTGILVYQAGRVLITNTLVNNSRMIGVDLNGAGYARVVASQIMNTASSAQAGATGNFYIRGGANFVVIDSSIMDECFGTGVSNVTISASSYVTIRDADLYFTDAPVGVGYGVYVDATSTHVKLDNVKLHPYGGAASAGTIYLAAGSSAHWIQNVLTVPTGGVDIVNGSTGSTFIGVNPCDTSAAPGAATCNGSPGISAIAAAAASVVITNALVTTGSGVTAQLQATDATCLYVKSVVPAAGSFTINVNAACTGTTKVAWSLN